MINYRDYNKELDSELREGKLWAYNLFIRKKFQAALIEDNENFFIFQWKAPDTIEYSAKYVIDKKEGYLIIYGDTGECIATWGNEISPKDLEAFVSDTEYFLSKTILSTDTYTYYQEDIEKDFREWKEKIEKNGSRFLNSDDEDILYALIDCEGDLSKMSDYDVALVEKYYGYLDPELENVGKRISKRVYLWSVGYQMAAAQLGIARQLPTTKVAGLHKE